MSNLLSQASLVMIPSGYKEDVVYSPIPTNGNGDLSFTRASNGTRINSAGLVEVTPWNFVEQSSNLGSWSNAGVTITTGITDAYGTTNAVTMSNISSGSATDYIVKYSNAMSLPTGTQINYSVYLKGSGTIGVIIERSVSGDYFYNASTVSLTNAWVRYDFAYTIGVGVNANGIGFYVSNLTGTTATSVDICFPQVNYGSTAKPYFPTTDRLNVPRLTYQNGGGGCPSLLLEKQSTNYVLSSQNLATTWSLSNTTATANSTTSPDGTQNASKLEDGTNNGQHRYYQTVLTGLTNQTLSFSIYAKQGTHRYISWGITDNTAYRGQVVVDLQTGTITDQTTDNSTLSNLSVASQGNGWYRISGTMAVSVNYSGGNAYAFGLMLNSASWSTAGYTGTNTFCYLWGGQAELSSYPTSYIPTTSASATRVADACFKTGISSLIGQTEGTMFIDMVPTDVSGAGRFMNIYNGSNTSNGWNAIISSGGTPNTFRFYGDGFDFQGGACLFGVRVKVALAYKNGVLTSAYVNGASVGTLTAVTTGKSYDTLTLGEGPFGLSGSCNVNESIIFPTALTNAELASLTTI